jgi:hypothetical protein
MVACGLNKIPVICYKKIHQQSQDSHLQRIFRPGLNPTNQKTETNTMNSTRIFLFLRKLINI